MTLGDITPTGSVPPVLPAPIIPPDESCPPGVDGMVPMVVDGFSYNSCWRNLPYRFFPNALAQLDIMRRANNLRPRWFCVPDEKDNPIAGYSTLYYQIAAADGSLLWGYSFAVISATDPDGAPTEVTQNDICVQWVDDCSSVPEFLDFAAGGGLASNGNARIKPSLLTTPRIILDPGLVNVQLTNRTENDVTCQLLLHFAEPCRVIDECDQQRVWARRAAAGAAR